MARLGDRCGPDLSVQRPGHQRGRGRDINQAGTLAGTQPRQSSGASAPGHADNARSSGRSSCMIRTRKTTSPMGASVQDAHPNILCSVRRSGGGARGVIQSSCMSYGSHSQSSGNASGAAQRQVSRWRLSLLQPCRRRRRRTWRGVWEGGVCKPPDCSSRVEQLFSFRSLRHLRSHS